VFPGRRKGGRDDDNIMVGLSHGKKPFTSMPGKV